MTKTSRTPLPAEVLSYLDDIDFLSLICKPQKKRRKKAILNNSDHRSFQQFTKNLKKDRLPNLQLSSIVLQEFDKIMNSFLDIFLKELASLARIKRQKTLSVKQLECVTKLCFPGFRGSKALDYGRVAVLRERNIR